MTDSSWSPFSARERQEQGIMGPCSGRLALHQDFLKISKFLPSVQWVLLVRVCSFAGRVAFPGLALYYGGAYFVSFGFKGRLFVKLMATITGN